MATEPSPSRPRGRPAAPRDDGLDYRFTLANERTFLAWVRTSLALIAAGVAVVQFVPGASLVTHSLGVLLISLGGVLAAMSYRSWQRNEEAMERGERLPRSPIFRVVAVALPVAALAAFVIVVLDLLR